MPSGAQDPAVNEQDLKIIAKEVKSLPAVLMPEALGLTMKIKLPSCFSDSESQKHKPAALWDTLKTSSLVFAGRPKAQPC